MNKISEVRAEKKMESDSFQSPLSMHNTLIKSYGVNPMHHQGIEISHEHVCPVILQHSSSASRSDGEKKKKV